LRLPPPLAPADAAATVWPGEVVLSAAASPLVTEDAAPSGGKSKPKSRMDDVGLDPPASVAGGGLGRMKGSWEKEWMSVAPFAVSPGRLLAACSASCSLMVVEESGS
jgi:hypothetical protein